MPHPGQFNPNEKIQVIMTRGQLAGMSHGAPMPGMGGMSHGAPMPGMGGMSHGAPMPGMGSVSHGAPMPGMGAGTDVYSSQEQDAYGLPPQDLINSLYDIFGKYPRKNVLPYANGFNLLSSDALSPAITALGTSRPKIQTSSDAAHVVTAITGASTGEYSIFMRTDSSDRQLMTVPVISAAMVGTGERPFFLPKPLLLAPNTTVSFDLVDLSNATNEVWFTFWGFKIYRRQYAAAG